MPTLGNKESHIWIYIIYLNSQPIFGHTILLIWESPLVVKHKSEYHKHHTIHSSTPQTNCWLDFQFLHPSVFSEQATACFAPVSWPPPTNEITITIY